MVNKQYLFTFKTYSIDLQLDYDLEAVLSDLATILYIVEETISQCGSITPLSFFFDLSIGL